MTRAERVITFIGHYCRVPEGALVGSRLELEPFQEQFIRAIYDNPHGTKKAYLSIARKNGKSALIACLLLAHLVGPEAKQNSQIVTGAMSREQASLIFALAVKMIRLNPELEGICRILESKKVIFGLPMNVEFKALAAQATTAHGLSPALAILDEVGQIRGPQSEFIDAITTSQGAHADPLLIAISTQAANDADLFSIWLDDAEKSSDPRVVAHCYSANLECKLDEETAWRAANPALGRFRSIEDVRQQAAEAIRMPSAESTFRNLILNQRIATGSPFVTKLVWERNGAMPAPLAGLEVFGGLDLSTRTDLTALVLVGRDNQGIHHVFPYFWTPSEGLLDRARRDRAPYDLWVKQGFLRATPGATVDYEYVARDIAEIISGLNVSVIGFDPHRIDVLQKEFARIGATPPLVGVYQGFNGVNPGICNLEAELLNDRIRHGMHPVLTACAAGAVTEVNSELQRRFSKKKTTSRIDGIVALALAFSAVSKAEAPAPEPTYQLVFL